MRPRRRSQLHSMTRSGATYYYHANHRGDVVAMTDAAGNVVNTYAYGPYGEILSADETVENPYRYAGYRFDKTTGLYYLWNRYYDPDTCRFMTRDPYPGDLDNPMSMNPYLYCLGDPVHLIDTNGLKPRGPGMPDGYGPWGYNCPGDYGFLDSGAAVPNRDMEIALVGAVLLKQGIAAVPLMAQ
ncbi:MAG: hypothetical protein IBX63_09865 [Coriobacteriia bacterium]|nr:hypothetical protein [Coriobacteriia bacterium]